MAETTHRARRLPLIGSLSRLESAQGALGGARRYLRRHPETFALLAAALAWPSTMLLHEAARHDGGRSGAMDAHLGHPGHGIEASHMVVSLSPLDLLAWVVMVVAMMVPLVWPAARHVGLNSLRWRRQRAISMFLTMYVAVWTIFGVVVLLAFGLLPIPGTPALGAALIVAALWQLTPQQLYFRWACHRTVPLPPRGWPAVVGDFRFGLRQGLACVGVCWPHWCLCQSSCEPEPCITAVPRSRLPHHRPTDAKIPP
jgi:predicted metal-binding membrane protein